MHHICFVNAYFFIEFQFRFIIQAARNTHSVSKTKRRQTKDRHKTTIKMQGMVATKKLFKGRKMSQAKTEAKGFEQVQLPTKSLAALDLPPPPKPVEVIEEEEPVKKERVEKIISDWVSEL